MDLKNLPLIAALAGAFLLWIVIAKRYHIVNRIVGFFALILEALVLTASRSRT